MTTVTSGALGPIERIAVRHIGIPTGMKSFVLPNGHRTPTELSALLVRIVDRDGGIGQSLLWSQQPSQLALFEAALRYLAPAIAGPEFATTADAVLAMRQASTFVGPDGLVVFGISGFEMALQDLALRRSGTSLADALGRQDRPVRAYQTGLFLPSTIDELIDEARQITDAGITAIKMIVGKPSLDDDVERLRAVKDSLPEGAELMVDALQRWNVVQALEAAERFADVGLVWLEDPLPNDEVAGYAEVVRHSPVKIATGESCFSPDAFGRLLDTGLPYVVAELERVGGIGGWMNVARLARERGAVVLPHIYPHISAQLLAALDQDEVWWEYVPWFDRLLDEPFTITDGLLRPSPRPGSGFDPAPDAIEEYAATRWIDLVA